MRFALMENDGVEKLHASSRTSSDYISAPRLRSPTIVLGKGTKATKSASQAAGS